MSKNIELKKEIVENLKNDFLNANSIIFVDYKGINVAQDTELRRKFRENNVTYKVVKNRLLVRALENADITGFDPKMFEGTTAVAFSQDETASARIFSETKAAIKKLDIKFGVVNGRVLNRSEVETLAKIPAKPVLIAMLLGVLLGPASALVRALNEIGKKQS